MNAQVVPQVPRALINDFPNNAKGVLKRLGDFYVACKRSGIPWDPADVLIEEINLSVFHLVDGKDIKRTNLRAVQQLSLADIILEYLALSNDDDDRFELLRTIFYSMDLQKGDVPLHILGLVACLGVAFKKVDVLDTLGLWMATAGLESPPAIFIAQNLSKDFTTDEFPEKYNDLPQKAFRFTSVLLVSIAKAYKTTPPPKSLIIQVATWIESTPRVCLFPPQSPVFDLFRWCIETFQGNQLDKSRLRLALMSAVNKEGKGTHFQFLPEIKRLIQELRVKRESSLAEFYVGEVLTNEMLEKIVDSLLQMIQMFISAECLDIRDIRQIFDSLEASMLPRTELFKLLKAHHLNQMFYTFREPKPST